MNNLVSIIIPVYNVENYLRECIESVLSQKYGYFELILINDGSTDSSGEICEEYKLIDNRIKVIHKKNGGLSSARNVGLDNAVGEWIIFLDSDDKIKNDLIQDCVSLVKDDIDVVWYNYNIFGEHLNTEKVDRVLIDDIKIYNSCEVAMKDIFLSYGDIVVWNKMYSSSLFRDIRFPIGKLHEDEFVTYRLIFKARKIIRTFKKYYDYRINPSSIMHTGSIKRKMVIFEAINERLIFFKRNNCTELEEMDYANLFNNLKYFYQVMSNESVAYQDDLL